MNVISLPLSCAGNGSSTDSWNQLFTLKGEPRSLSWQWQPPLFGLGVLGEPLGQQQAFTPSHLCPSTGDMSLSFTRPLLNWKNGSTALNTYYRWGKEGGRDCLLWTGKTALTLLDCSWRTIPECHFCTVVSTNSAPWLVKGRPGKAQTAAMFRVPLFPLQVSPLEEIVPLLFS